MKKRINFIILLILILLTFKVTPVSIISNNVSIVFIEIIILLLCSILVLISKKLYIDKIGIFLLVLLFSEVLSSIRLYLGFNLNPKLLFNYLLYFLSYTSIYSVIKIYNIDCKSILTKYRIVIFVNIIVSMIAYNNILIFSVFNVLFETDKTSFIGDSYNRFAGTFSNPNFLGIFYALYAGVTTFFILSEKKNLMFNIVSLLCAIYLINISGSRSALLTYLLSALTILFIIILDVFHRKRKLLYRRVSGFLIVIVIVIIVTFQLNYVDIINVRFFNTDDIFINYYARIEMIIDAFSVNNNLLGTGRLDTSTDNQFAKYFLESGVAVTFIFIAFLIAIFSDIIKKNKCNKLVTIIVFIAYLFNLLGAALFDVTQITTILFVLIVLSKSEFEENSHEGNNISRGKWNPIIPTYTNHK